MRLAGRRPRGPLLDARVSGQAPEARSVRMDDVEVDVAAPLTQKRDPLAVGRPFGLSVRGEIVVSACSFDPLASMT